MARAIEPWATLWPYPSWLGLGGGFRRRMPRTVHNIHGALFRVSEDYLRQKGNQSGSVRKRGGDWYIAFRELIADENGNIKYRSTERKIDAQEAPRLTRRRAEELGYQQHVSKANGLTITPGAAATATDGVLSMAQRQALLGHTRAATTMGYTTGDLEKLRAAMDRPQ